MTTNFEYTNDELSNFSVKILKEIAKTYNLKPGNINKTELIKKIENYQRDIEIKKSKKSTKLSNSLGKFNYLPLDILRLTGSYLHLCDLIKFCKLNKKSYTNICQNNIFLRDLGLAYLTGHPERLPESNKILDDIRKKDDDYYDISRGYEKRIKKSITEFRLSRDRNMLNYLSKFNYPDIIGYLLSLATPNERQEVIDSLFSGAARYRNLELIKYLVSIGADVHLHDDLAIVYASQYGDLPMAKYLIGQNADVNTEREGRITPLVTAVEHNHLDMVKYLISVGADIHRPCPCVRPWLRRGRRNRCGGIRRAGPAPPASA